MNTQFQAGDRVTSNVNAQGLTKGATYTVEEVCAQPTPFGTFVTYFVVGAQGDQHAVRNGHLVLDLKPIAISHK